MGQVSDTALRVVAANIQAVLEVPVEMLAPMTIPEETLQPHRGQYDAGLILQLLARLPFPHHLCILTITNVDLCNPMLTYVFGEAELGRKFAIASNFRLKDSGDGTPAPDGLYYERLAKVALHEVAHTLSLYHCESPKCLMQIIRKVRDLDERDIYFCERCNFVLRRNIKGQKTPPTKLR
ncbi:MAG: hypothetical protein AB9866_00395 [Syntrophobacteraceae bacterium]